MDPTTKMSPIIAPIAKIRPCEGSVTGLSMTGIQKNTPIQRLKNEVARRAAALRMTRIPAIIERMNPQRALGEDGCIPNIGYGATMGGAGIGGAYVGGGAYDGAGG